jgi:hypothetical protein
MDEAELLTNIIHPEHQIAPAKARSTLTRLLPGPATSYELLGELRGDGICSKKLKLLREADEAEATIEEMGSSSDDSSRHCL